jgi:predicted ArsR family transcriptional regulator
LEKKMFRLTTHNRSRVPNRLAFFAAVMLVISALAGTSDTQQSNQDASRQIAGIASGQIDQAAGKSPGANTVQGSRGFKMSLFLFRGH